MHRLSLEQVGLYVSYGYLTGFTLPGTSAFCELSKANAERPCFSPEIEMNVTKTLKKKILWGKSVACTNL